MNIPKLELYVSGELVYCGRGGCGRRIGYTHGTTVVLLDGFKGSKDGALHRWGHRTLEDGSRQFKRFNRVRRVGAIGGDDEPMTLSGTWRATVKLRGRSPRAGDIVVCPNLKCMARQRVPIVPKPVPG